MTSAHHQMLAGLDQSEYAKTSYAAFVAQAAKLSELHSNLAKAAFKPAELAIATRAPTPVPANRTQRLTRSIHWFHHVFDRTNRAIDEPQKFSNQKFENPKSEKFKIAKINKTRNFKIPKNRLRKIEKIGQRT